MIRNILKRLFPSQGKKHTAKEPQMPTMTMDNKNYSMMASNDEFAISVVAKQRCLIKTTYQKFAETYRAAGRRLIEQGGTLENDFNYEKHLRVLCLQCQSGLTPLGIGLLLMSQSDAFEGPIISSAEQKSGVCRKCSYVECYVVYDPEGFKPPLGSS